MTLLAIDTAADLCSACVWDRKRGELGRCVREIATGHAELVIEVIARALGEAGIGYRELAGIGVSVGPGSFTGVRVGVATARGLALALKCPAVGVTTLAALADEARASFPGRPVLSVIDARRGQVYAALYDAAGTLRAGPMLTSADDIPPQPADPVLAGSAAAMVASCLRDRNGGKPDIAIDAATADIASFARLAAHARQTEKPRPLYLRGADAKPQSGFALPRMSG